MDITTTDTALLRLLQLASPALPVGAYAFSQGLEAAIDQAWLTDANDVYEWLGLQLDHGLAHVDLPIVLRLQKSWLQRDSVEVRYWNSCLLASRETSELRLAETATGEALARLLPSLDILLPYALKPPTFAALFALAAAHWRLSAALLLHGYAWAWLENQVMAATKLLPLGQSQSQALLSRLLERVPAAIETAQTLPIAEIGGSLPGLALASIRHENQYSRLFRS
ncbi:MAG TPA: urease accessory UreF family protein [Candidatus Acidoferrum sp.]|nr:urease accessory UreF family protein [Candidatus Acidoferrum sp.]